MKRAIAMLLLAQTTLCHGQTIKGKLFGEQGGNREILPGGVVHWLGTTRAAIANGNGVFELKDDGITDRRLVAEMMGYETDTISPGAKTYLSIVLQANSKTLDGVVIRDKSGAYISSLSVNKTEVINQHELSKAACCDLAGCFGTQASVQPQTTNVITNAQELRILGLSGVYNQLLFDGLPMLQGVTYTYGVSTYPGTIVDKIYVSKGTASVLQGYESISGQVNLISMQPSRADKLYLNGYMNSFGERHLNANLALPVGKAAKWHTLLAGHMVQPAGRIDRNNDNFMDLPMLTRYMGYNKWTYGNDAEKGFAFQGGIRLVSEKRVGGQMPYDPSRDQGSNTIYGQVVSYTQPEAYAKTSYRFSEAHALALSIAATGHEQRSWFGVTSYNASQQTAYANLQGEMRWHKEHDLKYGLSYRYQQLKEDISFADTLFARTFAGLYTTSLSVPGLFAENTFRWFDDKIVLITGARLDRHQEWGLYLTPRALIKYAPDEKNTTRASAGRGWRQVNLFSEQMNLLISSRNIVIMEKLKPEDAFNWGVSHTYRFSLSNVTGTLSGDFYNTRFFNQVFPDYDSDPTKALISNFGGISVSNGLQAEASFTFYKRLDARVAYNYLDVYRVEQGSKKRLPFNPRHRLMGALSYRTENKKWQADANVHWFDAMRLPDTRSNPAEYVRPLYSVPYYTLNVQGTFRWRAMEVYAGCENVFNYTQPNPIISAANPFGPYFDISSVWGPTRGREFYVGVRYKLK
ncbi:MAG: carboxypeptidase-like regulatory domain-containing protein [Taibaiella sp.]|nr:carboxypeptidase-like regulatory domain-containing protein [Taibaiella sp.]